MKAINKKNYKNILLLIVGIVSAITCFIVDEEFYDQFVVAVNNASIYGILSPLFVLIGSDNKTLPSNINDIKLIIKI